MSASTANDVPLFRPKPRRPFELIPPSPESPSSPTTGINTPSSEHPPILSQLDIPHLAGITTPSGIPKRSKSAIALTASTLFGIFNNDETEPPTPSSTTSLNNHSILNVYESGSTNGTTHHQLPSPPKAKPRRYRSRKRPSFLAITFRLLALLGFGVGYGIVVSHLHNTKTFTPSWWEEIESFNPSFLLGWGLAGVFLGSLLPWIDFIWDGETYKQQEKESIERKLPWQSTFQLALTIAMANPWLWYLIDRTRAGFWLSAFVGVTGTLILFHLNPTLIQAPETHGKSIDDILVAGLVPQETIGMWVWISSVLFCSSVCFGNIGRLLAFKEKDL